MSYDVYLKNPATGEVVELAEDHFRKGGTYAVGGTNEGYLNVTYNYGAHLSKAFDHDDGLRCLDGMTAEKSKPLLDDAIARLGDDVTDNYWDGTEGNAKAALMDLRVLAMGAPWARWEVV